MDAKTTVTTLQKLAKKVPYNQQLNLLLCLCSLANSTDTERYDQLLLSLEEISEAKKPYAELRQAVIVAIGQEDFEQKANEVRKTLPSTTTTATVDAKVLGLDLAQWQALISLVETSSTTSPLLTLLTDFFGDSRRWGALSSSKAKLSYPYESLLELEDTKYKPFLNLDLFKDKE